MGERLSSGAGKAAETVASAQIPFVGLCAGCGQSPVHLKWIPSLLSLIVLGEQRGKRISRSRQTLQERLPDTVGEAGGFQGQSIEEVSSGQIYRAPGLAGCR